MEVAFGSIPTIPLRAEEEEKGGKKKKLSPSSAPEKNPTGLVMYALMQICGKDNEKYRFPCYRGETKKG